MRKLCLLILLTIILAASVSAVDYFTNRMNFPPGESRQHTQTLTNNANSTTTINATIPAGFTVSSTNCNQINSTFVSCTIPASSSRYYTMTSPSSCTEGTIYKSYLTGQGFSEYFTFVCIPDNKITDCKVEYGHGDANYLPNDQPYISDEPSSLFNLVRVWNIGHYLTPDEAARNATISCQYERYPVRTYGRVEIDYNTNYVNGSFIWDTIESGYWFRIGVVSQDVTGKSIGDYYNKTCSNLTYQFAHHQVIAKSTNCNLEVRDKEPFTFNIASHPTESDKSILTITNSEQYNVYYLSFDKTLNGYSHTETYPRLDSSKSISYVMDNASLCNITIFFIPSWYINSWTPVYYTQTVNCTIPTPPPVNNPPTLIQNIPNQTWQFNTNNTNAFDLDNYFSDADNDTLIYTYTPVNNITVVINSTTHQVSFIPDTNFIGTRTITFYANDSNSTTPSNLVYLNVISCGNNIVETGEQCDGTNLSGQTCVGLGYTRGTLSCTASCTFDTSACTSPPAPPSGGGGGGGARVTPTVEEPVVEEEPIKDIVLRVISYPESIDITEKEFVIFVEVQNTGNVPLEGVRVEVDTNEVWPGETIFLGNLGVGERKTTEISFENEICSSESFVIRSALDIRLTAIERDVEDSEDILINMDIPELSVSTDRTEYAEGDLMRLCIIYNNVGKEAKEKLEFEIDFMYNQEESYIIDLLSPFSVKENKILIVTRDYVLENIPETTDYTIDVIMYQRGTLFTERYLAAKASTKVLLNGIIEDTILQRENSVYEFKYDNEQHSVTINEVNENFVDITIFSSPQNYRIELLETINVDLDEDGINDISLTYLGLKDEKADIRLKILPKTPKVPAKATTSFEVGLEERTPILEKPEALTKVKDFWDNFIIFVVKNLFRIVVIFILVIIIMAIAEAVFYFSPSTYKLVMEKKDKAIENLRLYKKLINDKFLNIKSILESKER